MRQLAWGRDGVSLYAVAGRGDASLYELRRADGTITARFPLGDAHASNIVIDARARTLYVGVGTDVAAFALAPLRYKHSITACETRVEAIILFEPGTKLFAACEDGALAEVDTDLAQLQRSEQVAATCEPAPLDLSAGETLIIFPCRDLGLLYLIDRVTLTVLDSLDAGGPLVSLVLDRSRQRGVITGSDGHLDRIELASREISAIELPGMPTVFAIGAEGSIAGALEGPTSSIVLIDRDSVTTRIDLGEPGPWRALAVWPDDTPVMRFALPSPDAPQP